MHGEQAFSSAGVSVSVLGDINGDGIDDFAIGAPNHDLNEDEGSGQIYVIYGKTGVTRDTVAIGALAAGDGFVIRGEPSSRTGQAVSGAGDFNGDGIGDILLGAAGLESAFVVFGQAGATRSLFRIGDFPQGSAVVIAGDGTFDRFGTSASGAGDVNGDGIGDIIIGAPLKNSPDIDSGSAFVVYGSRPTVAVQRDGTGAAQSIFGGDLADTINGMAGDDTIDGGKGADSLDGGEGADLLRYAASTAGVSVNLGTNIVSGGDAGGDVILNFEGVIGSAFGDRLDGSSGGDHLSGGAGSDRISGSGGSDSLAGGAGKDQLTGGSGSDVFLFGSMLDMTAKATTTDIIRDFQRGADKIDLSQIDASVGRWGNDAFVFNGTKPIKASPQGDISYLRVDNAGTANDYTMVFIDTDSDRAAEAAIRISGLHSLTASDFIL